jgi:SWI/SNF-related matrix-associated actin-dependent regulator of chromatin subfamily A3
MYEGRGEKKLAPSLEVRLKSPSYFTSETHGLFKGRIASEHHPLIEGLLDENTLRLHVICKLKQHHTPKKRGKLEPILPCSLDITVYGPLDLFEEIGEWFQGHEVYLQDPDSCHLEVRYCNPQRLSSDNPSKFPMISEIISKSWRVVPKELKELPEPSDFLDILSGQAELEETPQPSAIRSVLKRSANSDVQKTIGAPKRSASLTCPLFRHQKQALTFMLNREQGWGFDHGRPDVWEIRHTDQGRT